MMESYCLIFNAKNVPDQNSKPPPIFYIEMKQIMFKENTKII